MWPLTKLNVDHFLPIMRAPKRGQPRVADGNRRPAGDNGDRVRFGKPLPVHNTVLAQLLVLGPSLIIVALWFDHTSMMSFAAGAAVAILPHAWFAVVVFGFRRRRSLQMGASRGAKRAYAAHAGKFFMSAAGFALVFAALRPISAPAVFVGFSLMWVLQTVGSVRLLRAGY